ncbi:MAG: site-specific DNA-methyltransferase [Gammaproteobacteria bacterium]|nr:site-specific DNA-methyltransferase [Gammaproteobacteria bacterium]
MNMNLTLTNEDCMSLMARYPDKHFDIAICDPPYGILQTNWDNADKLELWLTEVYRVLKSDGTLICFGQQPMFSRVVTFMGKRFSHEIIWEKTQKGGALNANRMPLRAHENIAVSKVDKAVYYNAIKVKEVNEDVRVRSNSNISYKGYGKVNQPNQYVNDGTRHAGSIVTISNWNGYKFGKPTADATVHPTQKPVALYKWLLERYARPDAKVLDPFLGSGSIAIACHDLGFELTGCELDPDYYAAMMKRVNRHTAQTKLF